MTTFQELKLRKRFRYIVYRLNDDNTSIVVASKFERPSSTGKSSSEGLSIAETVAKAKEEYKAFAKEHLLDDDCRYAVYDFEFEKKEGEGVRNKICFFVWYTASTSCLSALHIGLPIRPK